MLEVLDIGYLGHFSKEQEKANEDSEGGGGCYMPVHCAKISGCCMKERRVRIHSGCGEGHWIGGLIQ